MVRTPESNNTHLRSRLPSRPLLPSSSRRAPNSRVPGGSRLRCRGRLLGHQHDFVSDGADRSGATETAQKDLKGYVSRTGGHALQHEDGRREAPTSNRHKEAAAQAPCCNARQLRKMAELLGPCVKFCPKRAPPPPVPARQHRLRLSAAQKNPLCSESLTALRLSSTASPKPERSSAPICRPCKPVGNQGPCRSECGHTVTVVRTPESNNTHLRSRLPSRRILSSSSRRAPNSRVPGGSRLRCRGRLLGHQHALSLAAAALNPKNSPF